MVNNKSVVNPKEGKIILRKKFKTNNTVSEYYEQKMTKGCK